MKKTLLVKSLLALVLIAGMSACTTNKKSSSLAPSSSEAVSESVSEEASSEEVSSEEESSEELSSEDVSSEEDSSEEESSEKSHEKGDEDWVDYVNDGSVKLGLDYKDKDFFKDGVGQFSLKTPIDGDTAHFVQVDSTKTKDTLKARFYGIDTPESTGKVQEYGRDASDFTKGILKEADANGTIVVSSAQDDYGTPNPDSTGSRYVSLVWVNLTKKNAPIDELVLLNLWIVQEGLSWVKNVQSMPQYEDTFYAAELQARTYKLKLFSGLPDPRINYGDYKDISLLAIKEEVGKCLADPDHKNIYDNEKLRIQGTVAGFSNKILYLEDFFYYDEDDPSKGGEYCGINIFAGMSAPPSQYTTVNTFIQVCGLALQSENFGFQVTDVKFVYGDPLTDSDSRVIYYPDENKETEHNLYTFEYTNAEMSAIASAKDPYNLEPLNCRVTITEALEVDSFFISDDQSITLGFKNSKFSVYIPFNYKGDPSRPNYRWILEEDFMGKKFMVTGVYVHHKTASGKNTFQIVPSKTADLVWVQETA